MSYIQPSQDVNGGRILELVTSKQIDASENLTNFWVLNSTDIGSFTVFILVIIIFIVMVGFLYFFLKGQNRRK